MANIFTYRYTYSKRAVFLHLTNFLLMFNKSKSPLPQQILGQGTFKITFTLFPYPQLTEMKDVRANRARTRTARTIFGLVISELKTGCICYRPNLHNFTNCKQLLKYLTFFSSRALRRRARHKMALTNNIWNENIHLIIIKVVLEWFWIKSSNVKTNPSEKISVKKNCHEKLETALEKLKFSWGGHV